MRTLGFPAVSRKGLVTMFTLWLIPRPGKSSTSARAKDPGSINMPKPLGLSGTALSYDESLG